MEAPRGKFAKQKVFAYSKKACQKAGGNAKTYCTRWGKFEECTFAPENVSPFYVVGMKTTSAANAVCCNVIANKIQGRVS